MMLINDKVKEWEKNVVINRYGLILLDASKRKYDIFIWNRASNC